MDRLQKLMTRRKRKDEIVSVFTLGVYEQDIAVFQCWPEKYERLAKRRLPSAVFDAAKRHGTFDPKGSGRTTVTTEAGPLAVLLWFRPGVHVAVVAHESFHATCAIAQHRGLKLCDESEEAFAYMLDAIIRKVVAIVDTL